MHNEIIIFLFLFPTRKLQITGFAFSRDFSNLTSCQQILRENFHKPKPKKKNFFSLWEKKEKKKIFWAKQNIRDAFDTRFGERLAINISTTPFQSMLLL
jgi:hypothetical protein